MSGAFFMNSRAATSFSCAVTRRGLLGRSIRGSGRTVIEVPHVGNRGLNGAFGTPSRLRLASPRARREHRVQLWALTVMQAITDETGLSR
jgi:hypothetical protein